MSLFVCALMMYLAWLFSCCLILSVASGEKSICVSKELKSYYPCGASI